MERVIYDEEPRGARRRQTELTVGIRLAQKDPMVVIGQFSEMDSCAHHGNVRLIDHAQPKASWVCRCRWSGFLSQSIRGRGRSHAASCDHIRQSSRRLNRGLAT